MLVPIRRDRTSKPPIGTPLRSDGHWSVQGLVGAWAFNDGGGDTAFDAVLSRPASITGAVWSEGLLLSGVGNYIDIPFQGEYHVGIGSTIFSVITPKVMPAVGYPSSIFATNMDGNTYTGISLIYRDTGYLDLTLGSGGAISSASRRNTTATSNPLNINKKFTCASVATSLTNANLLYVDGRICTTAVSGTANTFSAGAGNSAIGRYSNNIGLYNYGNTIYDLVYIFNRALPPAEIASLSANPWQIYEPEVVWITVATGGIPRFFAATLANSSDTSISLAASRAMAAQMAVSCDAAAGLDVTRGIAVLMPSAVDMAATVGVTRGISASMASSAEVSASTVVARSMSAILAGASDISAAIAANRGMSVAIASSSAISATAAILRNFSAALANESGIMADLQATALSLVTFAASMANSASAAGNLAVARSMSALMATASEVSAGVSRLAGMAATVGSISDAAAVLAVRRELLANVATLADMAASLGLQSEAATLRAILTVTARDPLSLLISTIDTLALTVTARDPLALQITSAP